MLSSMLLALLLSSSACGTMIQQIPLAISNPSLDNSSEPITNFNCDGLNTIAFDGGYKPILSRIAGGTNGCVYQFLPGWPFRHGSTIGKTPQAPNRRFPDTPTSESSILALIGELYAHTLDVQGRDWLVMKMWPGTWLTQTAEYQTMVGNHDAAECAAFHRDAYLALFTNLKQYILTYGCAHKGGTEMNEANVLFEYNAQQQATAHVVDWAGSDCSANNRNQATVMARSRCADYAYYLDRPNWCGMTDAQAQVFCNSLVYYEYT